MLEQLQHRLRTSDWVFGVWAGLASFISYFCMYMYRKPYTAGTYEQLDWWGLDYKIVLVIAQVMGYALSKFVGIKIISELNLDHRIRLFLALIGVAWLALVGFAFSPPSYGPVWLFINGLPLGMIWGIVFTYCEGRRLTEVITVIIACNFILTSGVAKTIGRWLLAWGVTEQMMPMVVGLLAFPLLFLSLWMLSQLPPPSTEEIRHKIARPPMNAGTQRQLLLTYGLPISLFVLIYLLLTIIRDIRDNFAVEIWTGLGYGESPAIFSTTELPVTLAVLLSLGLLYRIKDNHRALLINVLICTVGISLLLLTTWLFQIGQISPISWMVISGVGLFLPYILFNGILFDRFIASYRINGNVGFIMYIADATGYLGSILIMLYKNFGDAKWEWLAFYQTLCFVGGGIGLLLTALLFYYFVRQKANLQLTTSPELY